MTETRTGDVEPTQRPVMVAIDLLGKWGTRTEAGDRITADWGEPDADGWYTPTFTVHYDDNIASEARRLALTAERAARGRVEAALDRLVIGALPFLGVAHPDILAARAASAPVRALTGEFHPLRSPSTTTPEAD